jgi:hypothetical protein
MACLSITVSCPLACPHHPISPAFVHSLPFLVGFLLCCDAELETDKATLATAWANCMCRSYQFAESSDDKDDVVLVETNESWARRQSASRQPLTATEQREIRAVVQKRMVPLLKIKA